MPTLDRSLTLPAGEFFESAEAKSGIAIHHTVGGTARSTFNWWMSDRTKHGTSRRVGAAYLLARDGTIHEVIDPEAWAYQFGLPWQVDRKLAFEKRFIGIELASLGSLIEQDGELYCFDRVAPGTRVDQADVFDSGETWRKYRYWMRYPDAQVDALIELIDHLCDRFDIPRRVPSDFLKFYGEDLADFEGIIGHTMVRMDKYDPNPDVDFWQRIVDACGLTPVDIVERSARRPHMTDAQGDALFSHNAAQMNEMDPAAAGLVLSLLDELSRSGRNTYIRLSDPAPNGNSVRYEFIEGDQDLVALAARSLGFKSWSEQLLEAYGG